MQEMSGAQDTSKLPSNIETRDRLHNVVVKVTNGVVNVEEPAEAKPRDEEKGEEQGGKQSTSKSKKRGEDSKGQTKEKKNTRKSGRLGGESLRPA